MRKYLASIFLMGIILFGLFLLGQNISGQVEELKNTSAGRMAQLISQKRIFKAKVSKHLEKADELEALRSFNKAWSPYFSRSTEILNVLDQLAFKNTVAVLQKSITVKQESGKTHVFGVQLLNAKISGQYPRILKWLYEFESAYPHARVDFVDFKVESGKTTLEMQVSLPYAKA